MASNEDKKRWKKEAQQLKRDLDSTKVVEKREVAIKFPKKKPSFSTESKPKPPTKDVDDRLRRQLGI